MFEFIKNLIEEAKKTQEEKLKKLNNYTNSIDDDIVKNAGFVPLKSGGSNFKTHSLITDNFGNLVFKVKIWFPFIFVGIFSIGLIASIVGIFSDIINNKVILNIDNISNYIGQIIISGLFCIPIGLLFYFLFRSKIFDFQNGYFYDLRYKEKLFELLNNEKYKNKIIPINQIHALQIINESIQSKNNDYLSYELNIILKDSSRINIIDHGNLEEIRKNANELATRLGVKVYDITNL